MKKSHCPINLPNDCAWPDCEGVCEGPLLLCGVHSDELPPHMAGRYCRYLTAVTEDTISSETSHAFYWELRDYCRQLSVADGPLLVGQSLN